MGGLFGGAAVNVLVPFPVWSSFWVRPLGLLPIGLGVFLFAWATRTFKRHSTALMPWSPSSDLVRDGPYGFSRNPIYLSFALFYLGVGLVLNSAYILAMLVVVAVLFDRLQIPREERYLEETFGDRFREYKARVRRWV